MKIFVFGDSHAHHSFRLFRKTTTVYQNSMSIYECSNIIKETPEISDFVGLFYNELEKDSNVIMILCLGEIDARCLIHKQIMEKGRTEDSVIDDLVDRYKYIIKHINTNANDATINTNNNIWIMSVIPTSKDAEYGHEFSQRGTLEERIKYTRKLNTRLKEASIQEKSFHFLDIHDSFANENGILNEKF